VSNALAGAGGPDFYKLRHVASDDVLNMRAAPLAEMPTVAKQRKFIVEKNSYGKFLNINDYWKTLTCA